MDGLILFISVFYFFCRGMFLSDQRWSSHTCWTFSDDKHNNNIMHTYTSGYDYEYVWTETRVPFTLDIHASIPILYISGQSLQGTTDQYRSLDELQNTGKGSFQTYIPYMQ